MQGLRNLLRLQAAGDDYAEDRQQARRIRRVLRLNIDPFDMTPQAFRSLYRLNKLLVRGIIEEIRMDMPETERRSAISVEHKVLAAISFFAHGSYQKPTAFCYCAPMSQTMISRSIYQVTTAMNLRMMGRIAFPMAPEGRERIKQRFYQATGMPGTIGAIDCTHVAILRPHVHEEHYINRKSYHSLNAQAICDFDMRILNISARYPGATGDSYIWRNSRAKQELLLRHNAGERGEWLIGDSGYPNEPWLLLPILNAEPGSPEENYTTIHCKTRCCVERCFGLLKARWRCLIRHRCLHYGPHRAALILNACAILHNIAINARLPDPEPLDAAEILREEQARQAGAVGPDEENADYLALAREVRNGVVRRLWHNRH